MYFNRIGKKIRNVKFTDAEQAALNEEIQRQVVEQERKYEVEECAGVLWVLKSEFGFSGPKLKRAMLLILEHRRELERHYEMDKGDGGWLALRKLRDCGVDVEAWYNEFGAEPTIERKEET